MDVLERLRLNNPPAPPSWRDIPSLANPATPETQPVTQEPQDGEGLQSSVLAFAAYDPRGRTLVLDFQNGSRYAYDGVPPEVYKSLDLAKSHGRYFNRRVRLAYPFRRLL